MASSSFKTVIGSAVSMVAGGLIAAVTLVGLISNTVNSSSDRPASVDGATIPYGTTQ